ncbi:MAG: hypothetical protein M3P06_11580 [Acidobacteriota bacterium]|nr:hypothetical protein [Acidobacteriota bacterium]
MAWVKLDDDFYLHPKLVQAGPLALAMQVAALCYSNHYKTRGFISYGVASRLLDLDAYGSLDQLSIESDDSHVSGWKIGWSELAEKLTAAGIWIANLERGGYDIHDYAEYQPEAVAEARHEARVQAGRAGGLARASKSQAKSKQTQANSSPVPDPVPDPITTTTTTARSRYFRAFGHEGTADQITILENHIASHPPDCVEWVFAELAGKTRPEVGLMKFLFNECAFGSKPHGPREKPHAAPKRSGQGHSTTTGRSSEVRGPAVW